MPECQGSRPAPLDPRRTQAGRGKRHQERYQSDVQETQTIAQTIDILAQIMPYLTQRFSRDQQLIGELLHFHLLLFGQGLRRVGALSRSGTPL